MRSSCGMVVEVLEDLLPGWYKVRTHYRYEGFALGGQPLSGPGNCSPVGRAEKEQYGN